MIPTRLHEPLAPPPLPAPGQRWAAFLDLDGTLVDFERDPDAVRVAPGTIAALKRLHAAFDGAFAIVSGRPLEQLDRVFGDFRPFGAGKHGHEWRGDNERIDTTAAPTRETVDAARRAANALAEALPGVRVEDKGTAFALHYRDRPEHHAAVLAGVERIVSGGEHWVVQRGDHVVELLPPGADKGRALARLMTLAPFAGRTPVAIGDDFTDEHMFEAAARLGGFGVVVGPRRPTSARYALDGPAAVHEWIERVAA